MKKLIYSQEDVDLMVSIETQQYQEELEYEHYCNEQLRNKITNLEYKIKRLEEDNKYKEVLDKIKEKGVMYYDPEYSKIYGELCSMPGANNTRTPVIVIDDEILELLEEIE